MKRLKITRAISFYKKVENKFSVVAKPLLKISYQKLYPT